MRWLLKIRMRLRTLLRRDRLDQELDEEFQFHIDNRMEQEIAAGASPAEARKIAIRAMDGLTRRKEECRDTLHMNAWEDILRDFRYALRSLRLNPGFAMLAILIMALGIGANSAVFSVVNAVLLKQLPYYQADRIVTLNTDWGNDRMDLVTIADYRDWRTQNTSFEAMATYRGIEAPVSPGDTAEYAQAAVVDFDFFRVFGVQPVVGRTFTEEETRSGGGGTVVISYQYWQSRYRGENAVLGRTIRVRNQAWAIVGVMPAGFAFPGTTDVWIPQTTASQSRTGRNFFAAARLKPDVSMEQAQSEMRGIAARLEQQYPESNKGRSVQLSPLRDAIVGPIDRLTLYLLWGVVTLVLLIACANTATLLLGKAATRVREIAVRASLGASRRRIVRQLIVESLVLAIAAGGLGLIFAAWGAKALAALIPTGLPREAALDSGVLAFTSVVSLATSLLFGLVPALHATKIDLNDALKQASPRSVSGTVRMRSTLVVSEIAIAVVLLAGAGLVLKSLFALRDVKLGFETQNVLVMRASGVASQTENNAYFREVLARFATVPGVAAVGATMTPPGVWSTPIGSGPYFIDRMPEQRGDIQGPQALMTMMAPGTFAALGTPLIRGRDFSDADTSDKPLVAIVNEALSRQAFGSDDPIGRIIFCPFDKEEGMTIVGVVGDVRQLRPSDEPKPTCFMPYQQHFYNQATLSVVARTAGDPTALIGTLRKVAREVSPNVPVAFTTMEESFGENVAEPRFRALLFTAFAALAVCLAMTGVYGVIAFTVKQRTSEIGLRMALGADRGAVLRMVIRQGLVLTCIGVGLGLAVAVTGSRLLEAILYEVQPNDPWVYGLVAALLAVVTLAASYVPARRAAAINPITAIRQE